VASDSRQKLHDVAQQILRQMKDSAAAPLLDAEQLVSWAGSLPHHGSKKAICTSLIVAALRLSEAGLLAPAEQLVSLVASVIGADPTRDALRANGASRVARALIDAAKPMVAPTLGGLAPPAAAPKRRR
jgi:hypothetical protein